MLSNITNILPEIWIALGQTFLMLFITLLVAILIGTPLGTILYLIRPGATHHKRTLYITLDGLVNIIRSFPFLILLIAIIPFTRFVVGTAIGTTAVIVPLSICVIPEFARLVEQTLLDVNKGIVEAAESMGANLFQVIWYVLYSEARAGLANVVTIITISLLSYTTVAGLVGGGGIGDFAIRYGYYRYQIDIMFFTVFIIIILVQTIQTIGNRVVRMLDKKK